MISEEDRKEASHQLHRLCKSTIERLSYNLLQTLIHFRNDTFFKSFLSPEERNQIRLKKSLVPQSQFKSPPPQIPTSRKPIPPTNTNDIMIIDHETPPPPKINIPKHAPPVPPASRMHHALPSSKPQPEIIRQPKDTIIVQINGHGNKKPVTTEQPPQSRPFKIPITTYPSPKQKPKPVSPPPVKQETRNQVQISSNTPYCTLMLC